VVFQGAVFPVWVDNHTVIYIRIGWGYCTHFTIFICSNSPTNGCCHTQNCFNVQSCLIMESFVQTLFEFHDFAISKDSIHRHIAICFTSTQPHSPHLCRMVAWSSSQSLWCLRRSVLELVTSVIPLRDPASISIFTRIKT